MAAGANRLLAEYNTPLPVAAVCYLEGDMGEKEVLKKFMQAVEELAEQADAAGGKLGVKQDPVEGTAAYLSLPGGAAVIASVQDGDVDRLDFTPLQAAVWDGRKKRDSGHYGTPLKEREEKVREYRRLKAQKGKTISAYAAEVGISDRTLRRWLDAIPDT